ncbi:MAG: carbamoyltransferase C-terminal domain-containing protein [bacterium]|nr:carbamoyltransferase C-terminal domain-containing protein [bacterium]MDD5756808.1 carbamoyltransferase C-terminal domain-containing protein [bacterium]
MNILGINDSHDSGVALIKDGRIVYAANEERFTRKKMHWGFPYTSLENMTKQCGVDIADIDLVGFGFKGMVEVPTGVDFSGKAGFKRKVFEKITKHSGKFPESKAFVACSRLAAQILRKNRGLVRDYFAKRGMKGKITFFDHHESHAASAYFTSGWTKATVVTVDGGGDGLAGSVYAGENGQLKKISECPKIHSAGNFWAYITYICGFDPQRHGGKITGLAAYHPSPEAYEKLRTVYSLDRDKMHFRNDKYLFWKSAVNYLQELMKGFSREEIAYAAQRVLEENVTAAVRLAVLRTGNPRVVLSGGVFANVTLNKRIMELAEVEEVFIHPHMGDGGTSLGAALLLASRHNELQPFPLENVYFGDSFKPEEIIRAIEKEGFRCEKLEHPERIIAELMHQGKVIGLFQGRMEYGPRALCNRSILARPTDPEIKDWLNKRMDRTEFMPFAPVIMEEFAPVYFDNYPKGAYAARFMTMAFTVKKELRAGIPGVVHLDGTARPQTVNKNRQPLMHSILNEYYKISGLPLCINTSFNKHEEPIVHSPAEALHALKTGMIDALFFGPNLRAYK